jgi:hypothetical protein
MARSRGVSLPSAPSDAPLAHAQSVRSRGLIAHNQTYRGNQMDLCTAVDYMARGFFDLEVIEAEELEAQSMGESEGAE